MPDGCDDSWWWCTWQDAGWGLTAVPQYKHEVQTRRWHYSNETWHTLG